MIKTGEICAIIAVLTLAFTAEAAPLAMQHTGNENIRDDGLLAALRIELPQNTLGSPLTYDVVMPEEWQKPADFLVCSIDAKEAVYLTELWQRFFENDREGNKPFTSRQENNADVFATAVWEIIYEDLPCPPARW
ncbi:MAG: hypothetical protein DRP62_04720 [Planctomycetota bacterium]|nr:MAG: hypothetical protein DRP62_04720 [Planctomycetota bacterium]